MQRQFVRSDAISRHLYCAVCQDVFRNPMRAPCGHSFCAEYVFISCFLLLLLIDDLLLRIAIDDDNRAGAYKSG